MAELLWTSAKPFAGMPPEHAKPLFALINRAQRDDNSALAPSVAGFARALNNTLLVTARATPARQRFPPHSRTWRGGGFGIPGHATLSPESLLTFFETPNRKYRVPGCLATSFDEAVANDFINDTIEEGATCTCKWIVVCDACPQPSSRRHTCCC